MGAHKYKIRFVCLFGSSLVSQTDNFHRNHVAFLVDFSGEKSCTCLGGCTFGFGLEVLTCSYLEAVQSSGFQTPDSLTTQSNSLPSSLRNVHYQHSLDGHPKLAHHKNRSSTVGVP